MSTFVPGDIVSDGANVHYLVTDIPARVDPPTRLYPGGVLPVDRANLNPGEFVKVGKV